jgi:hypothetical protein
LSTCRGHVLKLYAADLGSPTCLKHDLRSENQMQLRLHFSLLPFMPVATPWVPGHGSETTKRSNYSQPSARRRHLSDHASTAQHRPAMPFSLQHVLTTCQRTDMMPQHVLQASRPPQPMGDEAGVRTTQRNILREGVNSSAKALVALVSLHQLQAPTLQSLRLRSRSREEQRSF